MSTTAAMGIMVTVFVAAFGYLAVELRGLRGEMKAELGGLRSELGAKVDALTQRYIDHLEHHTRQCRGVSLGESR
jgi:hypothetical protein